MCGAGTLALGHNDDEVNQAMIEMITKDAPLHTLDLTTPVKDNFVHTLLSLLPPELGNNAKIQFCSPSGTDATDAAIRLCKTATGRSSVISFAGGYHGDDKKRMDIKALRSLLEEDKKAGNIPFLVVGTVGTTDFGSIDSLKELSEIARENNMWLHADYLNREEDEEDGYTNLVDKSLQTTRRFDALKVWMSFQARGKKGWSNLINTSMGNAQYLYSKLKEDKDLK